MPVDLSRYTCYPLWIDEKALASYAKSLGITDACQALVTLAHAVRSSAGTISKNAILIARSSPRPVLAVLGSLEPTKQERLKAQARYLSSACAHLRYLTYFQVEEDCARLANSLVNRFGHREIESARFVALPRGGLIVLGLLAMILGLKREQMNTSPRSGESLVVVVDDCSLTGARFGEFLESSEERRIVFAHLYSHPDLRSSVEDAENRVVACLSAHDLEETESSSLTTKGRGRWLSALHGKRYWVGSVESLCFPWNEPDGMVWDPISKKPSKGWNIVPAELCLGNRLPDGVEPIPVQVQPEGRGPIRPSERALFGCIQNTVVLSDLESGRTFALNSIGSDMWQALVEHGRFEKALKFLLEEYAVNEARLQEDLSAFIEKLSTAGLLESEE